MRNTVLAALAGIYLALPGAGHAQGNGIDVELNKLEPVGGACRAYLVFENATANDFDPFKLDLVMFDAEGVIAKRVAVEAGPLPAGKTRVKLFDINDLGCENIQRVLLNSVMTCQSAGETPPDCTALARPSSRTAASFIK